MSPIELVVYVFLGIIQVCICYKLWTDYVRERKINFWRALIFILILAYSAFKILS
jgi:hypothetical protein